MSWHLGENCRETLFEILVTSDMKPRFSILTLLGITAYVAVNVAAICYPDSGWMRAAVAIWVLVLVNLAVRCLDDQKNDATVFVKATLLSIVLYLFVVTRAAYGADMPEDWLTDWLMSVRSHFDSNPPGPFYEGLQGSVLEMPGDYTDTKRAVHQIAVYNTTLIVGLFGGWLALSRNRFKERRANKEKAE